MATPNVAGSLVLLQQYYREVFGTFLRAATLKALVIHTASDLELPGPDYRSGWGLLNVEAAAEQLTSAAMNSSALLEETLLDGESYRREFSVDGEGPVRVTLAWTDHPGVRTGRTASALDDPTLQLQNDLDLRLVHLLSLIHI